MATAKLKVPAPKTPAPKDPIDESNPQSPESESDASETPSDPPPVSNENVEPGAEQFDEPPKEKRSVKDRVKDIEVRWGKEFTEVMLNLHDHVFGTSAPVDHDASEKKEG